MLLELLYAVIAGLSDVFGGWLGFKTRISRIMPRYIIGFAAGILLSVTLLNVFPQLDMHAHAWVIALGFFVFYLIEKVVMLHACGEEECEVHKVGGITVFGMALDNVVDGIGIAIGYLASPVLGLLITVGVVVHEIPQGIASAVIMKNANYSKRKTFLVLAIAGVLYPIGALASRFVPPGLNEFVLAFVAGDFLYIGASDLLPEAHKKFNAKVILSLILGVAFVILLGSIFGPI
jgi:zinc transporter ZupT